MNNNNEVNIFQLFNILYNGKYIILIVTIFSVIFPSIFVYYYNYNSSFYASKKIVRLKLDGSEMIKINKIRQDFSNTIQNNDINPKYYLTSDVFETKKLIKLFSDHLKLFSDHLKDNTISGEESKINPFKEQLSDLDFEIIFPDIDVDGTDIKIYSDKEIDFKSIINNMIEYAINKTLSDLKVTVQNDFLFIMKYLEDKIYIEKSRFNLIKLRKERDIENAINKIKKQNLNSTDEVIKKLRYRLDKLKYYKEIATKLDIDLPISQQIHKVYLDYTNEYVRGYKALEIEIENLLEIIKDYNSFKIKNNTKDKIESIIDKYNFEYQEDIDRVEDAILYWQKKVNYLQISSLKHNKILNNLIPINTNNSIKIEKISQYNILRVSIISLILGFFAGIISVLFRYSVRNY